MGKKKSSKKQFKRFVKSNRVLLAALGGAAAGIAITNILGTDKAKQLVNAVEDSVKDFGSKVMGVGDKNSYKTTREASEKSKPASTR